METVFTYPLISACFIGKFLISTLFFKRLWELSQNILSCPELFFLCLFIFLHELQDMGA